MVTKAKPVTLSAPPKKRGFGGMDPEKQREIARLGGASVPKEKRSFSNPDFASAAGRKGGISVAPDKRSFSQDRKLASEAGRKGGQAARARRVVEA